MSGGKLEYKSTYVAMFWLMLHDLIFVVCSLVDISCANLISDDAVIAITVACSLHSLMFSMHKIFARALRIIASRFYGAGDTESEYGSLTTVAILTTAVGIVVGVLVLVFGKFILGLYTLTDAQVNLAYTYLQYRIPGYFIYAFANPLIRSIEAQGKTAQVTKLRAINLINIPLSLILVRTMGVAGIGLGTSIAEFSELFLLFIVFKPKFGKPKVKYMPEILKLGLSYIPECIFNVLVDNFAVTLCLIYLSPSAMVISQLVNKLYDNIVEIIYMTTQQGEITISREFGARNQRGIVEEYKKFKHCYIWILIWHMPITMIVGWVYLGLISQVSDLSFALALLFVRMVSAVIYYIGLPTMRILYIFGVIKPVMFTRLFGLCILQLIVQYISLRCGAGAFCIPISYFFADLTWGITNVVLLKRGKYLDENKEQ